MEEKITTRRKFYILFELRLIFFQVHNVHTPFHSPVGSVLQRVPFHSDPGLRVRWGPPPIGQISSSVGAVLYTGDLWASVSLHRPLVRESEFESSIPFHGWTELPDGWCSVTWRVRRLSTPPTAGGENPWVRGNSGFSLLHHGGHELLSTTTTYWPDWMWTNWLK